MSSGQQVGDIGEEGGGGLSLRETRASDQTVQSHAVQSGVETGADLVGQARSRDMGREDVKSPRGKLVPFREVGETPESALCREIQRKAEKYLDDDKRVMGQALGVVDDVKCPHADDSSRGERERGE